jgi:taurine dioxygenase
MYRADKALPAEARRRIVGLSIKHDGTYNSGGYVRQGVTAGDNPVTFPGVYHPLVCAHPETKRRMLYLGRRRNTNIGGLPLTESKALLDELWDRALDDEFVWHNVWQVGDVVLWDNRCTCTAAIHSKLPTAVSCIACKSKATRGPRPDRAT